MIYYLSVNDTLPASLVCDLSAGFGCIHCTDFIYGGPHMYIYTTPGVSRNSVPFAFLSFLLILV